MAGEVRVWQSSITCGGLAGGRFLLKNARCFLTAHTGHVFWGELRGVGAAALVLFDVLADGAYDAFLAADGRFQVFIEASK